MSKTKILAEKQHEALKMIEQAVTVKEGESVYFKEINPSPVFKMSLGFASEFIDMLDTATNKRHHVDAILELWLFMEQMQVLIGVPGVLDKLPEGYRDNASITLYALKEFFRIIVDDPMTTAFVDYHHIANNHPGEDLLERKLSYYDFSKRHAVDFSFFGDWLKHEKDKQAAAVAFYNKHFK